MRNSIIHMMEMIFGMFLLALGLFYLFKQDKSLDRLIDVTNDKVVETKDIYQQDFDTNSNVITDINLYAIVMGYREYPITIDGTEISVDGTEYDYYFTLIKKGSYQKSYEFDATHNITKVNYKYIGL